MCCIHHNREVSLPDVLRILTVNTHKGFSSFNRRFVLPELRDAIRQTDADLVFLQEVLGEHSRWAEKHMERWPTVPQYEFLADSIWKDFAYGRNAIYSGGHHGNALLSKYPLTTWRNIDISLNGIEKRGLLCAEIDHAVTGATVHLICTHLSLRERHRQIQLDKLCELVNSLPKDEAVVVAGDFNDWRLQIQEKIYEKAGLTEVFTQIHGAPAKTFPSIFPVLRLDRIYVRGAEAHHPIVLPKKPWDHLSDHKPIMASINL